MQPINKQLSAAAKPLIEYLHKYGGKAIVDGNGCIVVEVTDSVKFERVKKYDS